MSIESEIQKLEPSAVIEMFELDPTDLGGSILRFHAGTNNLRGNIVWQGNTYTAFPIQVTGFEYTGNGQLPRPKVTVANLTGVVTAALIGLDDLLGAKFTRKRTLAKFLDAENFDGGVNADEDATAEFADDVYYIDRKSTENRDIVEFELTAALDLQGVRIPKRQIIQNYCPWEYRGTECGYSASVYFDANDQSTTQANDVCGKRLSSCKVRFGKIVPFGGFPAAGLVNVK
jgi:lambda family phage minor tail protein L